jgi:hypothetical protein
MAMIELDAQARSLLEREIGAIRSIRPIYPLWQQWAGWGGSTRPGVITGTQGRCKIVALRPELRPNESALRNFENRLSIYRALAGCSALPRLIMQAEEYVVTEWFEGELFSKKELKLEDIRDIGLAIGEAYSKMNKIDNDIDEDQLTDDISNLESCGTLRPGAVGRAKIYVDSIMIPKRVSWGPCFGDVALKNFIRRENGMVGYIDTMGVDHAVMGMNYEKVIGFIGEKWRDVLLKHVSEQLPDRDELAVHGPYFRFVLLARQIRAKSTGGRGLVALQRRMRAKAAARKLESLIHSEGL